MIKKEAIAVGEVSNSLPLRQPSPEKTRECVLLIDDSQAAMRLVEYALEEFGQQGYVLEWAKTLAEGLDRISKGPVDLVVLDLGLPDCSGPTTYAWVRELTKDRPVVVFTADPSEETDFSLTASGVADYLLKEQTSGPQLVQAIRLALYATEQENSSAGIKLTRRWLNNLL